MVAMVSSLSTHTPQTRVEDRVKIRKLRLFGADVAVLRSYVRDGELFASDATRRVGL
jgi:hypothetical protein